MGIFDVNQRHDEIKREVVSVNSLYNEAVKLDAYKFEQIGYLSEKKLIIKKDEFIKLIRLAERMLEHLKKADGIYSNLYDYQKEGIIVTDSKGKKEHYSLFRIGISTYISVIGKMIEEAQKQ
jgi:hypothetical protein